MNKNLLNKCQSGAVSRDGRKCRNQGFTLVEATISLLLMGLLMLGTVDLFIASLRGAVNSESLVFANLDAANALQNIVESTREAYFFQLPDESDFSPPAGATAGSYETTMAVTGGSETICTGMLVCMPNATYTSATGLPIEFNGTNSVTYQPTLYTRQQGPNGQTSGQEIMYFRADPNGAPDATNGTCLWAQTVGDQDGSQPTINRAIISSLAGNIPNALQFVRPQTVPNGLGVTSDIPYEVEIKVICSYYAPTGGGATNEVSNGEGTTSLDGKCVFMRDHELSSQNESGSTNSINNHFLPSGP
jgi:type II secretory pathway pseudopilin PulG